MYERHKMTKVESFLNGVCMFCGWVRVVQISANQVYRTSVNLVLLSFPFGDLCELNGGMKAKYFVARNFVIEKFNKKLKIFTKILENDKRVH